MGSSWHFESNEHFVLCVRRIIENHYCIHYSNKAGEYYNANDVCVKLTQYSLTIPPYIQSMADKYNLEIQNGNTNVASNTLS